VKEMSEQDKRPVYMGNFERFRKETQVKQEDLLTQITFLTKVSKINAMIAGLALGMAISALAI
jgi:hypothetical protein